MKSNSSWKRRIIPAKALVDALPTKSRYQVTPYEMKVNVFHSTETSNEDSFRKSASAFEKKAATPLHAIKSEEKQMAFKQPSKCRFIVNPNYKKSPRNILSERISLPYSEPLSWKDLA